MSGIEPRSTMCKCFTHYTISPAPPHMLIGSMHEGRNAPGSGGTLAEKGNWDAQRQCCSVPGLLRMVTVYPCRKEGLKADHKCVPKFLWPRVTGVPMYKKTHNNNKHI